MKKRTYSKKVRPAVIEMYRDGCRQKDIALSLGLSRYQVYRITGTCDFFMPEDHAASSDTQFDEDDLLSPNRKKLHFRGQTATLQLSEKVALSRSNCNFATFATFGKKLHFRGQTATLQLSEKVALSRSNCNFATSPKNGRFEAKIHKILLRDIVYIPTLKFHHSWKTTKSQSFSQGLFGWQSDRSDPWCSNIVPGLIRMIIPWSPSSWAL